VPDDEMPTATDEVEIEFTMNRTNKILRTRKMYCTGGT
jgi:hypothetical protein